MVKFIDVFIPSFIIYQCMMMNEANIGFYHCILWGFVYFLARCLQAVIPKINQWLTGVILLSGTVQASVGTISIRLHILLCTGNPLLHGTLFTSNDHQQNGHR